MGITEKAAWQPWAGGGKFSSGFTENEMSVKRLGRDVEQAIRYSCSFPEGPAVFSFTALSPVRT